MCEPESDLGQRWVHGRHVWVTHVVPNIVPNATALARPVGRIGETIECRARRRHGERARAVRQHVSLPHISPDVVVEQQKAIERDPCTAQVVLNRTDCACRISTRTSRQERKPEQDGASDDDCHGERSRPIAGRRHHGTRDEVQPEQHRHDDQKAADRYHAVCWTKPREHRIAELRQGQGAKQRCDGPRPGHHRVYARPTRYAVPVARFLV